MELNVNWSDLKSFATARSLSIQSITFNGQYFLWAIDGPVEIAAIIPIVTPTPNPSDQYDFETNYLPTANQSPRGNVVQVLGKDALTLSPFGSINTSMTANGLTVWDIVLPQTVALRGGILFSPNANMGDWISIQVVDKDNVLGYGGAPTAPTMVATYVISWYIMPGIPNELEDISISETLPAGLYMRVNYTSTSSTAPVALINFLSYLGA